MLDSQDKVVPGGHFGVRARDNQSLGLAKWPRPLKLNFVHATALSLMTTIIDELSPTFVTHNRTHTQTLMQMQALG